MKMLIYIFTIYMLALSLAPCSDGGGGIVEFINHSFGIEHQHNESDHQHSNDCGDDTCSPFCICSCCSIALDSPASISLVTKLFTDISREIPSFIPKEIPSSFTPFIWQPPWQV